METKKIYQNYPEYSRAWAKFAGIRLRSVYVNDFKYDDRFLYINRIANYSNPKFRILGPGDKVKNCIKITFDLDRWNREYLKYMIEYFLPVLTRWSRGTCHKFLTHSDILQVLSGAVSRNGSMNRQVLYNELK